MTGEKDFSISDSNIIGALYDNDSANDS